METSTAIENEGTEILSDTYNLQDVPNEQFPGPFRAYCMHKIALWPGFEAVAAVSETVGPSGAACQWRRSLGPRLCEVWGRSGCLAA